MSDEEREIELEGSENFEGAEVLVGSGEEYEPVHVEIPQFLPVLPLKNTVLFPFLLSPLLVRSEKSKQLIDEALLTPGRLLLSVAISRAGKDLCQRGLPPALFKRWNSGFFRKVKSSDFVGRPRVLKASFLVAQQSPNIHMY